MKSKCFAAAICAVWLCALPAVAQQAPAARSVPIEFSEPGSKSVISNLNSGVLEQQTAGSVEDALKNPGGFNPDSGSPFEPQRMMVRPPPPVIKSKQIMDLLEKRKDWVFLNPEESEFGLTAKQIFNLREQDPTQMENGKMTPMERYYKRETEQSADKKNDLPKLDENASGSRFQQGNAWSSLFSPQSVTDSRFKQQEESSDSAYYRTPFARTDDRDPFGTGGFDARARERVQDTRREAFERLLETGSSATAAVNPAGGSGWLNQVEGWGVSSSRPVVSSGLGTLPEIKPNDPKNFFGAVPTVAQTPTLRELPSVATPLGMSPSLTPALATEEQKRPTMPPPVFEMPKSRF